MTEREEDPVRRARVEALIRAMQEITDNQMIGDIQMALANVIGQMCLRQADPEGLFLSTLEDCSEVFRAMRAHVKAGKDPQAFRSMH